MSKTNPEHYRRGSIQPWDFIVANDLGFLEGNIIKYIVRAGHKHDEPRLDDLTKAATYLRKLLETTVKNESFTSRSYGTSDQVSQSHGSANRNVQSSHSNNSAEADFGGVRGSYGGTC